MCTDTIGWHVMLCVGLFTWVFGSVFVVEELLGADF